MQCLLISLLGGTVRGFICWLLKSSPLPCLLDLCFPAILPFLSSPPKACLCLEPVCLLQSACGMKCLLRNLDNSLLHLYIEFLYRSTSVIHFPTDPDQYNLAQLKGRETHHGVDGGSKHCLHKDPL